MIAMQKTAGKPFDVLRQFVKQRRAGERCELCGAELPPEHDHLVEIANRKLLCACGACAVLFDGQNNPRHRRVPRRVEMLDGFAMTDAQWESLNVPINLAFFFYSTPAKRVVAFYPSPAGPTESLLPLESWQELAAANPVLGELEPDVEALLVNRVADGRVYYRVPIDSCYKLVGLIRTHWRGLSGGTEVWREIKSFFAELAEKSHA
jgi:hypothetical protein